MHHYDNGDIKVMGVHNNFLIRFKTPLQKIDLTTGIINWNKDP